MASLEVHLYETHIGDLVGDSWRDFDFVATSPAIDRFGVGSTVLWESVALVPHQPRGKAARRRVFESRPRRPSACWPPTSST